jgi:hypothetical protein
MKKATEQIGIMVMILLGFIALNYISAGIDFLADNYSHILGPIALVALFAVIVKVVNTVLK